MMMKISFYVDNAHLRYFFFFINDDARQGSLAIHSQQLTPEEQLAEKKLLVK